MILQYFRHIFWTIWVSQHNQYSGLIERANMDGSERIEIVSNNLLGPMSITVDHVLKMIYWVDAKLNTLESADFQGLKRYFFLYRNKKNRFIITFNFLLLHFLEKTFVGVTSEII